MSSLSSGAQWASRRVITTLIAHLLGDRPVEPQTIERVELS